MANPPNDHNEGDSDHESVATVSSFEDDADETYDAPFFDGLLPYPDINLYITNYV
jgi:hypothetical protein